MPSLRESLRSWSDRHCYAASLALIAAVTALGLASTPSLGLRASNIDTVYLLAVLISALRWGRNPSIFTAVVSAVLFDFCFVPPQFTFGVTDLPYGINLLGYLAVAVATSALAARSRALTLEHAARETAEARTRAKDEILDHISHELRSPLNSVLGWTQMLERRHFDPDGFGRAIHGLEESARLLGRLIDDLLSASRITAGKFAVDLQPVDLAPIIATTVDTVALDAEVKGIRIDSIIEPTGTVVADAQRIEQVVTNLLSNAVKFTPDGGRITVRLVRTDQRVVLTVSDTGVGIPKDFLPHVFEPFSQGDSQHAKHGLGLGLSIVKHLVAAHGGEITVSSRGPGSGATFTMVLPGATAVAPSGSDAAVPSAYVRSPPPV